MEFFVLKNEVKITERKIPRILIRIKIKTSIRLSTEKSTISK